MTTPTRPRKTWNTSIPSRKTCVGWVSTGGENLFYASNYFDKLYDHAEQLIKIGKAYVDDLSAEEIRAYRGTLTEPGKNSPHRDRTIEENLDLFRRMRGGEFEDGAKVLRAKIDMAAPNMVMRDPTLYRIRRAHHHRTGDKWCIYPMYDFTHCLSDSTEMITHSICTLEFEDNRALYDWVLDQLGAYHPQQIEFARLNLNYTVMSKRKLLQLVQENHVDGWDDPRMPTIAGMRRRGFTAKSIRDFCEVIGVGKSQAWIGMDKLENAIRGDLNTKARRTMAVLDPLKVVITNYPEGQTETLSAPYLPDDPEKMGFRDVPFSREIYIERDDFMEEPFKKYFRLAPGREVRLRWAYFITCTDVIKDPASGEITELHCTYDPATKGGDAPDGRKVKGTIHWVSAEKGVDAQVRLYDRLFQVARPDDAPEGGDWKDNINPESLVTVTAKVEPSLAQAQPGDRVQFERKGYFVADRVDHKPGSELVFNRIVTLRDSWAKMVKKNKVN